MSYLLLVALAPVVFLLRYVWKKDKVKEPPKLLWTLFFLGVISVVPTAFAEGALANIIESLLTKNTYIFKVVYNFIGVALVEEGFKFLFLFIYTHKNKQFNSFFDGMIYAVFVSLGFAALENIMYVFQNGFSTGIMRAITAVPGHMFFAVFMGYYYSLWHTYKLCNESEKYFANLNMIRVRPPEYKYKSYLFLALLVPMLVHGFYDFTLSTEEPVFVLLFFIMLIILYIVCFSRIKKQSKADMEDYKLIPLMLCRKYPELIGVIIPRQANPMAVPNNYYQQNTYYNNQNIYR